MELFTTNQIKFQKSCKLIDTIYTRNKSLTYTLLDSIIQKLAITIIR